MGDESMKYNRRIRIFVAVCVILLFLCLLRLGHMQLFSQSFYRSKIAELKRQSGQYKQLKTVRGKILDRKARPLAVDEPAFELHISYKLCSAADERVAWLRFSGSSENNKESSEVCMTVNCFDTELEKLEQIIEKCTYFGIEKQQIEDKIRKINNKIWDIRTFQAWRKNCPKSKLLQKNRNNLFNIKRSDLLKDFAQEITFPDKRLRLIGQTEIAEMYQSFALLELRTDDDIFTAQMEFLDVEGISIVPKAQRFYPFGSAAAQTIGWVGPPQKNDKEIFEDDRLFSYLSDEVCGREDGVEYLCEQILRGRRGELFYDIDKQLVGRTKAQFGQDVKLTIDIELQQRIEQYIVNPNLNTDNYQAATAAVVIDIASGDILAMVSLPSYDLNTVRNQYSVYAGDSNEPMRNRAINKQYPPGSVIKPVILIAALETGKATAQTIIRCPAQSSPKGWPNCWIFNRFRIGHDDKWYADGGNNIHNAIKGSCNIFFSRLADRIEPSALQKWLWSFGYSQVILHVPFQIRANTLDRRVRQVFGQISTVPGSSQISDLNDVPMLSKGERRFFGIGQGNLRVTPLQVANAMATISRGGIFKNPRLFIDDSNDKSNAPVNLNISQQSLELARDGMKAVVNEQGGTAQSQFAPANFGQWGVKVYGKTGSTENPENAWFAGFAEDKKGRSVAVAVLVEGGQHGSSDAAPIASEIIQFCIEAEYIGNYEQETIAAQDNSRSFQ